MASSLVKKQYTGARILGITLMLEDDSSIYRIRTLSDEGVVKSVFVDGKTGEVFE